MNFRIVNSVIAAATLSLGLVGTAGAAPCGNIGYTGCCDGTVAKYCTSSGTLSTKDCSTNTTAPKCGWVTGKNYYSCNATESVDPAGKYPRECSKLPDGGIPDPDKGTTTNDAGAKDTGAAKDASTVPCGQVTSQGCCDGETLKYCYKSALSTKSCTSSPKCGWDTTKNYYTCGTSGLADPAGKYSMKCPGSTTGDSGVKNDTGSVAQDKGSAADTAAKVDTAAKKDTGALTHPKKTDSSDGCSVSGTPAAADGLLLTLLGLGLLLARRRRG